ncbi:MAG: M1 family metallopeptidase, partial [Planctomycetota bacterium]
LALASLLPHLAEEDPRTRYDIQSYRLDLEVDPEAKLLSGTVGIEAKVDRNSISEFELDLSNEGLRVASVFELGQGFNQTSPFVGREIIHRHENDRLICSLSRPYERGEMVRVAVRYSGTPMKKPDNFTGFFFVETPSGAPWIATSCQGIGAHTWFPCKASYFHPEDKHDQLFVNLTLPEDLTGVSNGRLVETTEPEEGKRTFRWFHPYGCGTYAITLNVAPYVHVQSDIPVVGLSKPVPFHYFVLPENEEKAKVQFAQVPQLLHIFSTAFGPFPFPESKYALVETPFWGMEHSTAVAYGSSYPAWCVANEEKDAYESRNKWFDYILVHETTHEWWGNSVTCADYGHFWIHEGFGTYAETVYVEQMDGLDAAHEFARNTMKRVRGKGSLYRGEGKNSGEAYGGLLYSKGASVLHMLRGRLGNDPVWWQTLQDFQAKFRNSNATTEEFKALLEKNSGRKFDLFFQEWFYGSGTPKVTGTITVEPT